MVAKSHGSRNFFLTDICGIMDKDVQVKQRKEPRKVKKSVKELMTKTFNMVFYCKVIS
ncbi:hypothetical protein QG37_01053 [Candidozyma auris]|uniref:Uncharacterized protein n=1 Tax=Candidozyma auris TaxID=498019 RepID=A0A0L0P5S2_CANAR|nr:hypothetical protein QG37_01053 [[Candida] auris]